MVTTYLDNASCINLCLLHVRKKTLFILKIFVNQIVYYYIDFRFNFLLTQFNSCSRLVFTLQRMISYSLNWLTQMRTVTSQRQGIFWKVRATD